jgi:membrane associated rhomboid family serine protease
MKHEDRRKELGKMLIDVGKYFLTAGILGGFFADKLTITMGASILVIAVISAIAGFYIIPAKKE